MKYRLVDKIIAFSSGESIRGIKAVSFEEYSLRAQLGMEPDLPQSLALGALLELGSWLVMLSSDFSQMAWTSQIDQCRFTRPVRPGQTLTLHVALLARDGTDLAFSGHASVGDAEALHINQWRASSLPLSDYHDPADLRVLASEIGPVT